TVRLPVGEAAKTVAVARQTWTRLADLGVERGDVVVGLGGGAATDVAGFVAATYLRGIPWISVPTSLTGMVDAGIGGKTAGDLPQGVLARRGRRRRAARRRLALGPVRRAGRVGRG